MIQNEARLRQKIRLCALCLALLIGASTTTAAPYAAMVVDAQTGEVLHSRNADTRLHPAGLTKLMTLYAAFYMLEAGEVDLDDLVTISSDVSNERPVKLGLPSGTQIKLKYLIRAAGVMGANDAATAIAEYIGGSKEGFLALTTQLSDELGLDNTTLKNAHGLTRSGHLSSVRDIAKLSLALRRDFPEYWGLFSHLSIDAGIKTVNNSGRRMLESYRGAEAVKFGHSRAAGFNEMVLATRGGKQILVVVFGGRSTATLNARVVELLDLGFERAASGASADEISGAYNECVIAGGNGQTCAVLLAEENCGAQTISCLAGINDILLENMPYGLQLKAGKHIEKCTEDFGYEASINLERCKTRAISIAGH